MSASNKNQSKALYLLENCCWINVYFVSSMTTMAVKNGLKISD